MSWLDSGSDRKSTLSVLPRIAVSFAALYDSLWAQPHLPAEILELCRLRLAQLHRSEVEWQRSDVDVIARKRNALREWHSDNQFSDAERACLAFTEVYAMDAQAITDELAQAVKNHFGDSGLVLLVEALGILDGMTRLTLLWQLPVDTDAPGIGSDWP
jgi:alkylhydroperoxidase family enzyme